MDSTAKWIKAEMDCQLIELIRSLEFGIGLWIYLWISLSNAGELLNLTKCLKIKGRGQLCLKGCCKSTLGLWLPMQGTVLWMSSLKTEDVKKCECQLFEIELRWRLSVI